jgi:DNA-binding response OmpR family regulator
MKVLIVDDEPTSLQLYGALLRDEGHEVLERDKSLGTTPMILSERPDLVLVDVSMPGLSGDELVRMVKGNPRAAGVSVVLFSSRDAGELEALARRCGAAGYLVKRADHQGFVRDFRTLAEDLRVGS